MKRPPDEPGADARISRHLQDGFIVLTGNPLRQGCPDAFEAWAHTGPLDFDLATPVRFGLGQDPRDALASLDHHLHLHNKAASQAMPIASGQE